MAPCLPALSQTSLDRILAMMQSSLAAGSAESGLKITGASPVRVWPWLPAVVPMAAQRPKESDISWY
jgi:hypothetical protein